MDRRQVDFLHKSTFVAVSSSVSSSFLDSQNWEQPRTSTAMQLCTSTEGRRNDFHAIVIVVASKRKL